VFDDLQDGQAGLAGVATS